MKSKKGNKSLDHSLSTSSGAKSVVSCGSNGSKPSPAAAAVARARAAAAPSPAPGANACLSLRCACASELRFGSGCCGGCNWVSGEKKFILQAVALWAVLCLPVNAVTLYLYLSVPEDGTLEQEELQQEEEPVETKPENVSYKVGRPQV